MSNPNTERDGRGVRRIRKTLVTMQRMEHDDIHAHVYVRDVTKLLSLYDSQAVEVIALRKEVAASERYQALLLSQPDAAVSAPRGDEVKLEYYVAPSDVERFYFLDSHGDEPFIRESDHKQIIKEVLETLDDAVIRVGCSANCYDVPADANSGAEYVAMRTREVIQSHVAAPAERTRVEGEQRLLTPEELADIERFQHQRRKSPVAEDAWLYVAEIDRLLTHIRLDREQLENEIFQDATDPAFTSDSARRAAREWMDTYHAAFKTNQEREDALVAIISKHFAAVPADNDAESVALIIPTCGDCPFVDHSGAFTPGGAKAVCGHRNAIETFAASIEGDERYHWKYRQVDREAAPPAQCPLRTTTTKGER